MNSKMSRRQKPIYTNTEQARIQKHGFLEPKCQKGKVKNQLEKSGQVSSAA